jgi:ligand-binding sensor domain-containing protein
LEDADLLRQSEILTYNRENGFVSDEIRAVLEDRTGAVWVGTHGGGLVRFFDGRWTVFTTTDGLSSNFAWALHEDADGALWIGTEHGLNRLQAGRFDVFTVGEGLFDDKINSILEDDFGRLWLGTDRGIYHVSKRELLAVAAGRARTGRSVAYSEADGLPIAETNGQLSHPNAIKTRDGRLWFPTPKGVVVIDPRNRPDIEIAPPVVVEQVLADGEVIFGDGSKGQSPSPQSQDRKTKVAPTEKIMPKALRLPESTAGRTKEGHK